MEMFCEAFANPVFNGLVGFTVFRTVLTHIVSRLRPSFIKRMFGGTAIPDKSIRQTSPAFVRDRNSAHLGGSWILYYRSPLLPSGTLIEYEKSGWADFLKLRLLGHS